MAERKDTIFGPLSDKTVVITGASSGVGRAAARAFAQEGSQLVLAARRAEALQAVAAECEDLGGRVKIVVTDVTDAKAVNDLAETAIDFGGSIDVWVNNAGVLAAGAFDETPLAVNEQVIQTNLLGYVYGAQAALPQFKKQGRGVLINNISVGGWFPTPYAAAYSASKFGLRGFTEALQGELHRWPNIHVCGLYPAFLDTPGIQHAANYTGHNIKPAPPVYDPQRVAAAMVDLAIRPRKTTIIGSMSLFLRLSHAVAPHLSSNITATAIETYLKNAPTIEHTSGNLFEPAPFGTSIHGGWNSQADAERRRSTGVLILAGLALGFLLLGRK